MIIAEYLFECFRGKKCLLFFSPLDSFHFCLISFMCCIGCFLAIWIRFSEQWDVWGLRGQMKNTALVEHSVTWHWLMRVRTWAEFEREKGKLEDLRAPEGGGQEDDRENARTMPVRLWDTQKEWNAVVESLHTTYSKALGWSCVCFSYGKKYTMVTTDHILYSVLSCSRFIPQSMTCVS